MLRRPLAALLSRIGVRLFLRWRIRCCIYTVIRPFLSNRVVDGVKITRCMILGYGGAITNEAQRKVRIFPVRPKES